MLTNEPYCKLLPIYLSNKQTHTHAHTRTHTHTNAPCWCPLVFPQASGPWTAQFQSMSKFIRQDSGHCRWPSHMCSGWTVHAKYHLQSKPNILYKDHLVTMC